MILHRACRIYPSGYLRMACSACYRERLPHHNKEIGSRSASTAPFHYPPTIITAMVDRDTPLWTKRLSCQPNFLDIGGTYIPMPLGNIPAYTRRDDYAKDCIKEIETIGLLEPVGPSTALLHSTTTENPRSTLKLAIGHLSTEYAYPIGAEGVRRGLRNAWDVVRVYGTLAKCNGEIVYLVDYIVQVEDFETCEETLAAVAKFAPTKYSMYKHDAMTSGQLQNHVEKVMNEEKLDPGRST